MSHAQRGGHGGRDGNGAGNNRVRNRRTDADGRQTRVDDIIDRDGDASGAGVTGEVSGGGGDGVLPVADLAGVPGDGIRRGRVNRAHLRTVYVKDHIADGNVV